MFLIDWNSIATQNKKVHQGFICRDNVKSFFFFDKTNIKSAEARRGEDGVLPITCIPPFENGTLYTVL